TSTDSGVIHFIAGDIVDARFRSQQGQQALWSLFDTAHGDFELRTQEAAPPRTIHLDSLSLIAEAERRRAAARQLKKQLGSANQIFSLGPLTDAQSAALGSLHGQVLGLFDGQRTLKQVVQNSPL